MVNEIEVKIKKALNGCKSMAKSSIHQLMEFFWLKLPKKQVKKLFWLK